MFHFFKLHLAHYSEEKRDVVLLYNALPVMRTGM